MNPNKPNHLDAAMRADVPHAISHILCLYPEDVIGSDAAYIQVHSGPRTAELYPFLGPL
jgi:hypothetical protein